MSILSISLKVLPATPTLRNILDKLAFRIHIYIILPIVLENESFNLRH
ncbi:hypothetical protein LEP1GSC039_3214 [Leptospira santarosai str. 2000027870]|nr:hypothetical protein LEP1GSC039_3214 [Leptospira santarosai str. 2000027870]